MPEHRFDVITLGRATVDLYGEQVGGPLEDMQSFARYPGGTPVNVAIGAARLGLRAAIITRVGDEPMGHSVRQALAAEGVDVSQVSTDPQCLTALVILGIRDQKRIPHVFFRENCADMNLAAADIDADFIASARALVVTGTHFSKPRVEAASRAAMAYARAAGTRVALDVDYRPAAWGLAAHADGEARFVASAEVTACMQTLLPDCDLVIGTEEEAHLVGGNTDTRAALRQIRALTDAVIVLKRGALGCIVYTDAIPQEFERGIRSPGFEVEVFNTLGAGDAFLSGLLPGWLRGESWEQSCARANACGAIVVSRHGCAPAMPSRSELDYYLEHGRKNRQPRHDAQLNRLHHATIRRRRNGQTCLLALEAPGGPAEATPQRLTDLHDLWAQAVLRRLPEFPNLGVIVGALHGAETLARLGGSGAWAVRGVETPHSRPLEFEAGDNVGLALRGWPREQVVKCRALYHPDDATELRQLQERRLRSLYDACLAMEREWMLELALPAQAGCDDNHWASAIESLYRCGIMPDWWLFPGPLAAETRVSIGTTIEAFDPCCAGVLLRLDPVADVTPSENHPLCRGFVIGSNPCPSATQRWLSGDIDESALAMELDEGLQRLLAALPPATSATI